MKKTVWVKFDIMKNFMRDVFIKLKVPRKDAETCADVLITADKMGFDSHGINRLKLYCDRIKQGIQKPKTKITIIKQKQATAVIDGHDGMGMVIAKQAMELAIKKAKKYGIAMAAVKNSTHYGIAGYYAQMAVKKGMIGITGTNTRPAMAPTFGVENLLGTNPLTFAIPTDEKFPFVLDCSTSITQRGTIEVYARKNKKIPKGWIINQKGKPMTDPKKILADLLKGKASFLPLGGIDPKMGAHKGYGYSLVVEILSAALQDGPFLKMLSGMKKGKQRPYHLGQFFIAIDVSFFIKLSRFKKITGNILRTLRSSKKMPGKKKIYTPGELEYLKTKERKNKGVGLNKNLQKEVKQMVKELNLTKYKTIFKF